MPRAIGFVPFLIWFGVILYLSFTPLTDWPKTGLFEKLYADKVVHITMYAILCWLFLFGIAGLKQVQSLPNSMIIYCVVLCSGIGISIEFLQPILTLYRRFEILDMVANTIGAIVGAYIFVKVIRKSFMQKALRHLLPERH